MSMKWYWGKIALKALAVFGVGFVVISLFRDGRRHVVNAVETNADLRIPLPFLPFSFDGERLGTFRQIVLHRSRPDHVEAVSLTVRVTDPASAARFGDCRVTVDDPTHLNEHSTFHCVTDEAGMTEFGSLRVFSKSDGRGWRLASTVPLLLPIEMTRKIQGRDAQIHASELERDRFRALGDSIQSLSREFATVRDAGERDRLRARMEELESEMSDLREAIIDAARDRADDAPAVAGASEMRVEVVAPEGAGKGASRVKVTVKPPPPR